MRAREPDGEIARVETDGKAAGHTVTSEWLLRRLTYRILGDEARWSGSKEGGARTRRFH